MQHPSNDWNPDSKVQMKKKSGIQYLESGIHGVESRIYYNCLGFPYQLCVHMHVNDAKFEIILQSNTLSSNLSVEKTITP